MSSDAQDFPITGRNMFKSSQIMNIFGPKVTRGTIYTPFVNVLLCHGNITDGDEVHFKASCWDNAMQCTVLSERQMTEPISPAIENPALICG